MYLIDTSIFSYLYRRDPIVKLYEPELTAKSGLFLSVQSVAELRLGANVAGWGEERRRRLQFLLARFTALPLDSDTAEIYADIVHQARQCGRPLGVQDTWIMATAKQYDLTLVTHDGDMVVGKELGIAVVCKNS